MLMLPFTFEETEIESNTSVITRSPSGLGSEWTSLNQPSFCAHPEHTSVSVQRDTSVPGTFEPGAVVAPHNVYKVVVYVHRRKIVAEEKIPAV